MMFIIPAPIPIVVVGTTKDLVVVLTSELIALGLWWYLQSKKRKPHINRGGRGCP